MVETSGGRVNSCQQILLAGCLDHRLALLGNRHPAKQIFLVKVGGHEV